MKRRLPILFVLSMIITVFFPALALASGGEIHSVNVNVILNDDGSAKIIETWDAQMDKNTEIFKPMINLGEMEIKDLEVTDSTGAIYETVPNWNVKGSISEKRHKAGLNPTNDGVEICWGIGDYDRKTYTVSYTLTNLVQGYSDYDGFNSRFINSDMSHLPKDGKVIIELANSSFNTDNAGIWAFGYDGNIQFIDGKIVASLFNGIRNKSEHVTIMIRLDKGVLHPLVNHNVGFSDLSDKAFIGSSYSDAEKISTGEKAASLQKASEIKKESSSPIFGSLTIFAIVAAFIFGVTNIVKLKGGISDVSMPTNGKDIPNVKNVPYSTEIPFEGYIPAMVFARGLWISVDSGDILNAYLLKWAMDGLLKIESPDNDKKQKNFKIYLSEYPTGLDNEEIALYSYLKAAETSEGFIDRESLNKLVENDMDTWNKQFINIKKMGKKYFINKGYIEKDIVSGLFGREKEVELYTETGIQAMEKYLGFKKFLKDLPENYSVDKKDDLFVYDVDSWDKYVIYGGLLNDDSQYGLKLGNLNPSYNEQSGYGRGFGYGYPGFYPYYLFYSVHRASSNVNKTMSGGGFSGTGGSASFGGGGGFSGGGFGGGSR